MPKPDLELRAPSISDHEAFVRDGYVILPAVLSTAEVVSLRARIQTILDDSNAYNVDRRAGTEWIRDLNPQDFPECSDNPRVLDAARALLGDTAHIAGLIMRNPVGDTAQQALHVDWVGPVTPGDDRQAQALFLLDNVDQLNGPTRLVPGSHRLYAVPDKKFSDPRTAHPDQVLATASAGDVLIFSSHIWHSGTANPSGRSRRTLTLNLLR